MKNVQKRVRHSKAKMRNFKIYLIGGKEREREAIPEEKTEYFFSIDVRCIFLVLMRIQEAQ